MSSLALEIHPSPTKFVTTADGSKQLVSGVITFSLCVEGSCQLVSALVVPSLLHTFILGSDFCRKFKLLIDFTESTWCVRVNGGSELCVCDVTPARSNLDGGTSEKFTENERKSFKS